MAGSQRGWEERSTIRALNGGVHTPRHERAHSQALVEPLYAAVLMRKNVVLMQLCILHLLRGESVKCQSVLPRMRGARRARWP